MAFKLMVCHTFTSHSHLALITTGVGAADITKLKANGYYTVAVGI